MAPIIVPTEASNVTVESRCRITPPCAWRSAIFWRLCALIVLVCSIAAPATAEPISYTFTATLTVTKWNMDGGPLSDFEDAYWFPSLENGGTYAATGSITYDPSLVADNGWQYAGGEIAFVTLDDYTWSVAGNLGFSAGPEGVSFADTFPTIVAGLPCLTMPATGELCTLPDGSSFYGEDGTMSLRFDGAPNFGDLFIWGHGTSISSDGTYVSTATSWRGTVDSITRVPEPATLSLLVVGIACTLRRHVSHRRAAHRRMRPSR